MKSLLSQFKERRMHLEMKQHDMLLRVGMSRQQYQQLESKGNPRLSTLELIAKGLKSEILLIPQEKLNMIKSILEDETLSIQSTRESQAEDDKSLSDDPWQGLLGDDE